MTISDMPLPTNISDTVRRLNPQIFGTTESVQRVRHLPHENNPCAALPDTKPKRNKAPALDRTVQGKKAGVPRVTVRFTGFRVRPLDPDNFAAGCKDALDGLRHSGLLLGDEPWRIKFETEQVKVSKANQEKTVIEIDLPQALGL